MKVQEKTMLEFAGFCFIYRPELGSDINTLIANFLNKKKEETDFDLWLKNFKEVDGCYWFDKETLYVKQAMKDIYKEIVKP